LQNKLKSGIYKYFRENFVLYLVMFICLIVGIVAGAITIKILNDTQKTSILTFFNSFFKVLENNDFNSTEVFKQSLWDNLKTIFIIWATGLIVIGVAVIPVILSIRGFALGFTVGFLVNEFGLKGFLFSLLVVLPQNLFIIPGIISISSAGVSFSINRIRRRKERLYRNNLISDIINYSFIVLLFAMLVIVGSIIEGYVSPIFMKFVTEIK